MGKILSIIAFIVSCGDSYAGQVIYKNMYVSKTIVQGLGQTNEAAEKDAVGAIPASYVRDPENAPMIECTVSEEMLKITNGEQCDIAIHKNLYRLTIPIVER